MPLGALSMPAEPLWHKELGQSRRTWQLGDWHLGTDTWGWSEPLYPAHKKKNKKMRLGNRVRVVRSREHLLAPHNPHTNEQPPTFSTWWTQWKGLHHRSPLSEGYVCTSGKLSMPRCTAELQEVLFCSFLGSTYLRLVWQGHILEFWPGLGRVIEITSAFFWVDRLSNFTLIEFTAS